MTSQPEVSGKYILRGADSLNSLIVKIRESGYITIGPVMRDGAVLYDEISSINQMPHGVGDNQSPGHYRLTQRNDEAVFGYVVGPNSWKKFLHPPHVKLWTARRNGNGFNIESENEVPPKFAFIGARPCEIAAIRIQDKVFTGGEYINTVYEKRRENAFIVAVNCAVAGGLCFCVSMNTGPKAKDGFDISLTEVCGGGEHYFLVECGTERGRAVIESIPHETAADTHLKAAESVLENTARHMGRRIEMGGVKELLYGSYLNPRWEETAKRCLTCGNCTMVCPTCFCTTVEDVTDLSGTVAERYRTWESCFTKDFTYIHGGSVRQTGMSRYRHWMIHKLAAWQDQFGEAGCVGCGRCIVWCPVGIDITEEAAVIRSGAKAKPEGAEHP